MKNSIIVLVGVLLAVFSQVMISVAEMIAFGLSIKPLAVIFGGAVFPIATTIRVGIPIGLLFYFSYSTLRAQNFMSSLLLVLPFGLLQVYALFFSEMNVFSYFYAIMLVVVAIAGVYIAFNKKKRVGCE